MKKRRIFSTLTAVMCCLTAFTNVNAQTTAEIGDTSVSNDELEMLWDLREQISEYILEKGYFEISADTSLRWDEHFVRVYAMTQETADDLSRFMNEKGISEDYIRIYIEPERSYELITGGQRGYDEINSIVTDGYFGIKEYLKSNGIQSSIYLTREYPDIHPTIPYTATKVYLRDNEEKERLEKYLMDNYYWMDVIDIIVKPDLAEKPVEKVESKSYVYLSGDANDDGEFGIADAVKLQKYLLDSTDMNERQIYSSDLTNDGEVNVLDVCVMRKELVDR